MTQRRTVIVVAMLLLMPIFASGAAGQVSVAGVLADPGPAEQEARAAVLKGVAGLRR